MKLHTLARVMIRQGDHEGVDVQAEANVLPLIATRIERGTLVIEDLQRYQSNSAEITVTLRRLERLDAGGATMIVAESVTSPSLSLSLGGSSTLSLKGLSIDQLSADLGGATSLKLSGKAGSVGLDMGGTAAVQAAELEAKALSISGGGTAHAVVWATQSLRISLGGAAGVRYYGVSNANVQIGGVAQVRRLGLLPPKPL